MILRKELHKALAAGVPSVGGRVYPLTMPQDTKHACVVYKVIGTTETRGMNCVEPLNVRYGIQIDCLAPTYSESLTVMEEVTAVLRSEFLSFNFINFEDYLNITLKYRQIIDVGLELKQTFGTPANNHLIITYHGKPVVHTGKQIIK